MLHKQKGEFLKLFWSKLSWYTAILLILKAKNRLTLASHMFGAKALGNSGEDIRGAIRVFELLSRKFDMQIDKRSVPFLEKANDW